MRILVGRSHLKLQSSHTLTKCNGRLVEEEESDQGSMTSINHPEAIRHFQAICDACQELTSRHYSPSELRLYADGYLHALRRCERLDRNEQLKLESIIERWIQDPSSFVGPDGDLSTLFTKKRFD